MPGALQRSQEREASQQRRIEELERELQTARASAEAAAASGTRESASPGPPQPEETPSDLLNKHVLLSLAEWASVAADGSIPRPKGTIKQLQVHMGIPIEHKPYYNAIRYHFGSRMDAGGIVWYTYYHHQDHAQVQKFLIIMRHEIPFLRRFAGNWASAEIVRTILKGRRDAHHRVNLPQDVALRATSFRPPPRRRRAPSRSHLSAPPNDQTQPDHEPEPQPEPQLPNDPSQDCSSQQRMSSRRPRPTRRSNRNENENENGGNGGDEDDDDDDDVEQPRPKRTCRQSTTNATSASRNRAPTVSATTKSSAASKARGKKTSSRRSKASGSKSRL